MQTNKFTHEDLDLRILSLEIDFNRLINIYTKVGEFELAHKTMLEKYLKIHECRTILNKLKENKPI